jgi:hypothetical protein
LIDACRQRGITLYLDGEGLRFRGPRRAMTPVQRQEVADHRAELATLLRQPPGRIDRRLRARRRLGRVE